MIQTHTLDRESEEARTLPKLVLSVNSLDSSMVSHSEFYIQFLLLQCTHNNDRQDIPINSREFHSVMVETDWNVLELARGGMECP